MMNIRKTIKNISVIKMIAGIVMGIFGIYSLLNPEATIVNLGVAFALYALVAGILDIVMYFTFENRFGIAPSISIIAGVLSVIAGFLMISNPVSTTVLVGMLFPFWFLANCFGRIAQLPIIKIYNGTFSYWLSMILTIFGIVLSVYLMTNPLVSVAYTITFVAMYLTFYGVSLLVDGISGYQFIKRI